VTDRSDLQELLEVAWTHRERALVRGRTAVGAAARSRGGLVFGGCNLQHRYRSLDVHAEVAAVTAMVANGETVMDAIVVVSGEPDLAPCGACLDWILQVGGDECVVAWQSTPGGAFEVRLAGDMMPFHPPYRDANEHTEHR
jgi:cytidine deaminase